ncbi:MAG: ATP synthase F1 subunit delta [Planctomycetota bacterium]|jgi:F-type H+-transporting ATPase subunit delta|nr:ATP synthase F1 subunit delta [Planctomycetota bacterium]
MTRENILAGRYARALAGQAGSPEEREGIRGDILLLAELFGRPEAGAAELGEIMASPVHPLGEKLRLADEILGKIGMKGAVADFLAVLIRRGRTVMLPKIAQKFGELADAADGWLSATAETARPLTPEQADRLAAALGEFFGARVRLRQIVKPELLAGARIRVGDKLFEGSVLGKMERLRNRLAGAVRSRKRKEAQNA